VKPLSKRPVTHTSRTVCSACGKRTRPGISQTCRSADIECGASALPLLSAA
jgi:hypothetical protein